MTTRWLQEVFNSADQDSSGTLGEEKVIKLIKELNTGLATIKVKQKLKVSLHSNQPSNHQGQTETEGESP